MRHLIIIIDEYGNKVWADKLDDRGMASICDVLQENTVYAAILLDVYGNHVWSWKFDINERATLANPIIFRL